MPPKNNSNKRFATLSDLNNQNDRETSPSGRDDQDPENFFTGGEKSGLAVQNPMSGSGSGAPGGMGTHLVNQILRHARENKPRPDSDDEEDDEERSPRPQRNVFQGRPRSLKEDSQSAASSSSQAEGSGSRGDGEVAGDDLLGDFARQYALGRSLPRVTRRITFWRNGFTVEDSDLYRYDDPANIPYLKSIEAGTAPISLLNVSPGQGVDVHVERKTDEDYVPPKPKPGGYKGTGRRLGSPVPGDISSRSVSPSGSSPAPAEVSSSSSAGGNKPTADLEGEGDAVVQFRLGDGSKRKHRFNSSGSVQQLYDFVDSLDPSRTRDYVLQTTFPNKELKDKEQNLKEAKVVGAVVVQKWV